MKSKALLALLLACCTLFPALAQTPTPSQQTPTTQTPSPKKPADDQDDVVKITTNLVQVDAVVMKDGKHVTNLTADDFEIYEDGKKQTITSFAYISNVKTTTPQPTIKTAKTDVVPFRRVDRDEPYRTIAIVVDDLGLSAESIGRVRGQLRKFINEQMQPNDLLAIIRTGGEVGALQQFTNDKRILGRAVDMLRWNHCSRGGLYVFAPVGVESSTPYCGYRTYNQTLKALRFIIDSMGQLPGRKSMVLLSDSMPTESQDELSRAHDRLKSEGVIEESPSPFSDKVNYSGFLQNLVEKAVRASVVIYSVDTQGLPTVDLTAADVIHGNYRQFDQQVANIRKMRMTMLMDRREGGDRLARETGGFQVRNSNGLELDRIVQDQSGYYLLGYRPTEETFNRRFHKIKAKVKRGGMSVRTRFGFFGITEEDAKRIQPAPSSKEMANLALVSPFKAQDIEVDMTSFFADEPQLGSIVRSYIYLDVNNLQFDLVNGEHQASIEIHGIVFGDNGSVIEQLKTGGTIRLSDTELAHAKANGFGMGVNMPVKKEGVYQVRLAVRDRNSLKIGSAAQYVQVPNLKDKKLAVSGVVLGKLDKADGETKEQILNPGSRRFVAQSPVYFAYRLYNATAPGGTQLRDVVMQTKIFRDGKSVYTGAEVPVSAGAQEDLNRIFVDGEVKLGAELDPGNYYLQVVITDRGSKKKEASVVQWADFEIVK